MLYFVTGTDTDSGKTLISAALLAKATGHKCGFKPIASGCDVTEDGLRNSDALMLMAQSNMGLAYQEINPISFEPAIAPHIAASQVNTALSAQGVFDSMLNPAMVNADFALIEGAGGWRLPLGNGEYLSDTVKLLQTTLQQETSTYGNSVQLTHAVTKNTTLEVILVVGMKLGCLNHALLTQEALLADGVSIAGWVANQVDADMAFIDDNLQSLQQMMQAPLLGYVPHLANPSAENAARYLQLPQ
ncbi:ATP-dependent dethiobiotin synthetase BioD [Shewanella algicola]|uniref:ATP-dependent dethiobiotin synthetase BioD n=1 Tax=Shewanella algicola TaxID=640633 RepID=A0A9X1Z6A0_9GAMM|nr:dethiobiotin synthase [Shewanella algicola]MCL1105817.1 dethiobiotin synthase [Shewanella algicola]GGP50317.1 ATP-dependent dethiobiotin synthetase BioD [Shewanella algicola]